LKTHIDTSFVIPGLSRPPNIAVLKDMFLKEGFEAIENIYNELKSAGKQQPFSKDFYTEYCDWLAWKKDEDVSNRLRLYELAYESFQGSARVNYYVAYYSMIRKMNEQAIRFYRQSLPLFEYH
jgi:hypothetical protein